MVILLNRKLDEKFKHIETIKNKNKRNAYLKKKNKYEQSLLMSEDEIIKILMERVCVDIYEIITTLQNLENINLIFENPNELVQIQNDKFDLQTKLNNLISLCKNYNFSLKYLAEKMNLVIIKEGSFENGLIVTYK